MKKSKKKVTAGFPEKTAYEKAVSRLSTKINTSFTVNQDGTISVSDPSYDISGLNDYIAMLIHREQDSAQRAFKQGESRGYNEGRRDAERRYRNFPYGEFGFTDGKLNYVVRVSENAVSVYGLTKNSLLAMMQIPLEEAYKK